MQHELLSPEELLDHQVCVFGIQDRTAPDTVTSVDSVGGAVVVMSGVEGVLTIAPVEGAPVPDVLAETSGALVSRIVSSSIPGTGHSLSLTHTHTGA